MKKIISFILCVSLLASILCIPVSATEEVATSENIEEFCEDVNEMVNEYGDSDFVTPEFIEEEQTAEHTDEDIEINYCPRLIVQSNKPIDTYNAIDIVSGFSNFYIVQFENEEDINHAYEQYSKDKDIISVEYDISYNALLGTTEEETEEEIELTYEDYKNGWYLKSTGIDMVLEKYRNHNAPRFVIAVLDTGVDLNSKYLKGRLIETGFNNASDGDKNSEQDYRGHGTMVSSVIANCTTSNVQIANYRCINNYGKFDSMLLASSAILQAVSQGVDAINCSFTIIGEFALMNEAINYAYSSGCLIFAAAGNQFGNIGIYNASPLNTSPKVVCVGAHNKYNMPTNFTAYGKPVDILAPGDEMALISIGDKIESVGGTSFAAPFMASIYAMYSLVHSTVSFENKAMIIKNFGSGTDEKFASDLFGSGIANVLDLFDLNTVSEPEFSLEEGKYIGKVSLELFSEGNADIYYTTDYTYPSPTNGMLYTEPIVFEDEELRIRAVAYKDGKRSNYVSKDICSVTLGTDDMFTINADGVITGYTGNVKYLKIPEIINGITVTDIAYSSGFSNAEIYGAILPDTIEYLGATQELYERTISTNEQLGAFNNNEYIEFIIGKNVKTIGRLGVSNNTNLITVDFPNCEYIMYRGFRNSGILGASFPKVEIIGKEAFEGAVFLREIYLPKCQKIGPNAFKNTSSLYLVYLPYGDYLEFKETAPTEIVYTPESSEATQNLFINNTALTTLDLPQIKTIGSNAFYKTPVKQLELSQVQYIYSIPNTLKDDYIGTEFYSSYYSNYYLPVSVELSLPSTLKYCVPATDYKNEYIEYVVYGTAGINSYAEQWARENNIEFINISQETAIVKDIEPIWDKYSYEPLEFDARGFNRTYQWYGSKDNKQGNYDDKPIKNATDKTFNPDDYKSYPYYYCIMTSTDKDIDGKVVSGVTITSSMCENRLYYMFALSNTHINFDSNLIYTKQFVCRDFLEIVHINENTNYLITPSYEYQNNCWYGTGSQLQIQDADASTEIIYTLIVEGDINGDSVVDVIDASATEQVVNGHKELSGDYFLAGDSNRDEVIDIADYQQVVNFALQN